MSSRTLRMFISQEDLAAPSAPVGMGATEVVEPGMANDAPLFVLHGAKGDEPWVSELKSAIIESDEVGFAPAAEPGKTEEGVAVPVVESQQIDEANQRAAEDEATKLAELADQADDIAGQHKVFILRPGTSGDTDGSDDMDKMFTAVTQSAIDDPTNTVAAFLPVQGADMHPTDHREFGRLQDMLREQGVPCVTSVEQLVEFINFTLENHHYIFSMEAAKALRPGMKVRFSHGHGKIQKILVHPMKINGKVHHASKDKPLYVVKADKGGHVSIHKASALTPV